ncbi:hypothetical protein OK18_00710 [Chryseobacterium gallinarum]|uniref:Acyl-CoA dehydrogenase n=1 Tax=Chryseobacterium gallinarum TaxID=1324352 RepID=A0A0G3M032_CHRGL|nr:acyl-CoA dehydrogenase family protein [Chryseobacterium gallinarum]AKK71353.1 hypothetical protein OK18_00710 [Chryseobacterium gallinarum]MCL8538636.1 acyl-CoA/acyl-ACP dehydrogenase [Chryseobacterium gallinarum]
MQQFTLKSHDNVEKICSHFHLFDYVHHQKESISKDQWNKLVTAGIYLPVIPKSHNGLESKADLTMMINRAAYHNLGLAMSLIVSTLLFADNVIEYGSQDLKNEVIHDLLNNNGQGGIAIIEPKAGSGLSLMQTVAEKVDGGFRIRGSKHWQCFSRHADWWLITAKNKDQPVAAGAFGFYIHKNQEGGFRTVETYASKGLHQIDFGANKLDVFIPEYRRLNLSGTGIPQIYQLVIPTWQQFASLGKGFLSRIYEESEKYVSSRASPDGHLKDIDFVRYRLGNIAACRTICEALFNYVLNSFSTYPKGKREIFPAQCIKVMASDAMLTGAMHYQTICGANGYRYAADNNIAAIAADDAQAFVMLSFPNDVLSLYLAKEFLHKTEVEKNKSFWTLINESGYTHAAAIHLEDLRNELNYCPSGNLELVLSGKILTRIFAITALKAYSPSNQVDQEKISSALLYCVNEIKMTLSERSISKQISKSIL